LARVDDGWLGRVGLWLWIGGIAFAALLVIARYLL
jgi:hypothetical protein